MGSSFACREMPRTVGTEDFVSFDYPVRTGGRDDNIPLRMPTGVRSGQPGSTPNRSRAKEGAARVP
jgi:hypothetical protein